MTVFVTGRAAPNGAVTSRAIASRSITSGFRGFMGDQTTLDPLNTPRAVVSRYEETSLTSHSVCFPSSPRACFAPPKSTSDMSTSPGCRCPSPPPPPHDGTGASTALISPPDLTLPRPEDSIIREATLRTRFETGWEGGRNWREYSERVWSWVWYPSWSGQDVAARVSATHVNL